MKILKILCAALLLLFASSSSSFAQSLNELFIKDRFLELSVFPQKENALRIYPNELETLTKPVKYRVPILMYHYIGPRDDPNDATKSALSTWPGVLDAQIKTLKENGFEFLSNQELAESIDKNTQIPEKSIILTFDDSYKDFYINAYPILKKYNAKATLYVITGLLNHPNHLSINELTELSKDSLIELGAHTVHHEWLKDQDSSVNAFEVEESKKELERLINHKVVSFAYPYGAFDEKTTSAVKNAGFTSAVSTLPGVEQSILNRFILYRLRPGERVGDTLLKWLSQDKFSAF